MVFGPPDTARGLGFAVLAAVLSASALYFGMGLHPAWWLTWLAPLPVLIVAPRVSRTLAFLSALAAWFVGGLNMWHYLHGAIHIPLVVCLEILITPAVVFSLIVLLFRALLCRGAVVWAALSLPAAWVSYEYLSSAASPHSTFGNVAYSQMNWLPILQLASITGIWGISFCLFLVSGTVAILVSGQGEARSRRVLAIAVGTFLLCVLGLGFVRLRTSPDGVPSIQVALIASDLPQNILTEDEKNTVRMVREYAEQAEGAAAQGAQVIVLPEKLAVVLDSYRGVVDQAFRSVSMRTQDTIVFGLIDVTEDAKWNEARIYSPDGSIRTYAKHHMLPPFESHLRPGTTRTALDGASGRWGVTICKDMDFPRLSREYGNDGTGLLLIPAWDFVLDGWLHGRMAILRGVESGFSIARAAKQGTLTLTDNRGRVLAERQTGSRPFTSLSGSIPVRHDPTIYARWGDWFAWLCLAGCLLSIGTLFRRKSIPSSR